MNILYVCQYFRVTSHAHGSSRHYEIVRRLLEGGHRVHLLTTSQRFDDEAQGRLLAVLGERLTISVVGSRYHQKMSYVRRMLEFIKTAVALSVRSLRPRADVVLASSTPLTILIPALIRRLIRRTPYVFEVRDIWPDIPFEVGALRRRSPLGRSAWLLAWIGYRYSQAIIALSPDMKEAIIGRYGIRGEKVVVSSNAGNPGVGSAPKAPQEASPLVRWMREGDLSLIYGGAMGRANDVSWIVAVVEELVLSHGCDVRLLVAGDGAYTPRFDRRVLHAPKEVQERICRVAPMPKPTYLAILGEADLALNLFDNLPGLQTCSPNKVFDAWSVGVPVASNQGGWLDHVLLESGAGVPLPRDTALAAECLATVSEEQLVRMSAAAQRLCQEDYNWDRVADDVDTTLRAVVGLGHDLPQGRVHRS